MDFCDQFARRLFCVRDVYRPVARTVDADGRDCARPRDCILMEFATLLVCHFYLSGYSNLYAIFRRTYRMHCVQTLTGSTYR